MRFKETVMMKAIDEKDIILRLQDANTRDAAFTMLVNTFKKPLYWQIRRMVVNHDDADDILQNTFVKAWNALSSFRGDSKIGTWLYRIATNETLSFLERQRDIYTSLDNSEGHIIETLHSDPYFDGDETEKQLQQAIRQLPDKQRQIFIMKYFQDMKYEEISLVLGTSIGALKASYHHATKKICDFFNRLN